ncbi:hypothetical protein RHECNPAF_25300118 [Rhizobium etli CNPAF512]|nr:hypothetical protein RHECNPAF_25300118 [Rhizobium etli CNPAF512]
MIERISRPVGLLQVARTTTSPHPEVPRKGPRRMGAGG